MTFQVANGSIPVLVERFLRDALDVGVAWVGGGWYVEVGLHSGPSYDFWRIDWPYDREPTLQEAIETLMADDDALIRRMQHVRALGS